MKKYRLIKEYPGSPEFETILTLDVKEGDYGIDVNNLNIFRHRKEIENYPEFWEKVVEKDYEILSFIVDSNKSIMIKKSNGLFVAKDFDGPGYFSEEDILSGNPKRVGWNENRTNDKYGYLIHSVKRLSSS